MKVLIYKKNNNLVPAYDSDFENLKKYKDNEFYEIEIKNKRNILFHRKFFALLNLGFESQDICSNFELFREAILIENGFYFYAKNFKGQIIKVAKSISFANMDNAEFENVFNKVLDYLCKLIGTKSEIILQNLEDFY